MLTEPKIITYFNYQASAHRPSSVYSTHCTAVDSSITPKSGHSDAHRNHFSREEGRFQVWKKNDKTLYVCITISILVIDANGNYLERS